MSPVPDSMGALERASAIQVAGNAAWLALNRGNIVAALSDVRDVTDHAVNLTTDLIHAALIAGIKADRIARVSGVALVLIEQQQRALAAELDGRPANGR